MREQLIEILGGVKNHHVVLKKHQGTDDIIDGILKTHNQYKNDYDKIYKYFYTGEIKSTCEKIWNFLKSNVKYKIESEKLQTLRSPATILSYPADCKSFALFINGCIDAINRNENTNWIFKYRFAGYNPFEKYIEHTFAVVKKNNSSDEIWIDPVLNSFNEKKQPTYFKDKKTNDMALVGIAGIVNDDGDAKVGGGATDGIGAWTPPTSFQGRPLTLQPTQPLKQQSGITKALSSVKDIATIIPVWGDAIASVLKIFNLGSVPNPDDWKGWEALDKSVNQPVGTQVQNWIMTDGDDSKNEAINIISWMSNYPMETYLGENWAIKNKFGRYVTVDDILSKLKRNGFNNEAQILQDSLKPPTPVIAGNNLWVTLALVGAGVFVISKMKK